MLSSLVALSFAFMQYLHKTPIFETFNGKNQMFVNITCSMITKNNLVVLSTCNCPHLLTGPVYIIYSGKSTVNCVMSK